MAATWSDEETLKLVELWGDEEIQALLEGSTRNKHVYDRIAEGMREAGYLRSGVQCRDKIKKMKAEYKKIKDNNNQTGRDRKIWKFYDCMNDILGNKPATRPAIVIDSLEEAMELKVTADGDDGAEKGGDDVDGNEDGGEKSGEKSGEGGEVEQVEQKTEVKKEKQRKKRHTREDKFEKAMDFIVDKVITAQKESESMFMKLEEKRMKLDERILELEDRRLREDKDREERQRREERDFQCRMMMMMTQHGYVGSPPPSFPPSFDYGVPNTSTSSGQPWSQSDM